MRQSKVLAEREAEKPGRAAVPFGRFGERPTTTIDKLQIKPVECFNDWIAVVPYAVDMERESPIVVPGTVAPNTGVIVGFGPEAAVAGELKIGDLVVYSGIVNHLNLKEYDAEVHIISRRGLFIRLGKAAFEMVESDAL